MMKRCAIVLTLGLAATTAALAEPATFSTSATVTILESIAVTETAPLSFGTIDKPTSGSADYSVDAAGVATHTGDGGFLVAPQTGTYGVTGEDGVAYSASATAGACSDSGLALSVAASSLSGTLDDTVTVSGTLSVASTTTAGSHTCAYTVTASY